MLANADIRLNIAIGVGETFQIKFSSVPRLIKLASRGLTPLKLKQKDYLVYIWIPILPPRVLSRWLEGSIVMLLLGRKWLDMETEYLQCEENLGVYRSPHHIFDERNAI